MASKSSTTIDFSALQAKLTRQFSNLDPKDPSLWPALPRYLLFVAVAILLVVVRDTQCMR